MPNRDYHHERREYEFTELNREHLNPNPFVQFAQWMDNAMHSKVKDPTAMSVATVDGSGQPHSRIVLLKQSDADGFVFYTHYDSAKGHQITDNSRAALLFFWPELDRQIRIEGALEKISREQSISYFQSRPRDSQLAAASSNQSQVVASREALEQNFADTEARFDGSDVELPTHWGGYRLKANLFEFWQGRPNRLHDRFQYSLTDDQAWSIERLSP